MDPFTQKLLERSRARRELLQRKSSERSGSSKRLRDPLTDANARGDTLPPHATQESPRSKADQVGASIPSPSKRVCAADVPLEGYCSPSPRSLSLDSRRAERLVKADTPAIASVRSRLRSFAQQCGDEEASSASRSGLASAARGPRSRLDVRPSPARRTGPPALAQRISSWEGHSVSPLPAGGLQHGSGSTAAGEQQTIE